MALCFSTLKKNHYPLFGYRLCFSVVCDVSSESESHPAETVSLRVPALLSYNFDVCVVRSLKFKSFDLQVSLVSFMLLILSYKLLMEQNVHFAWLSKHCVGLPAVIQLYIRTVFRGPCPVRDANARESAVRFEHLIRNIT